MFPGNRKVSVSGLSHACVPACGQRTLKRLQLDNGAFGLGDHLYAGFVPRSARDDSVDSQS